MSLHRDRLEHEKHTVGLMIDIYCRGKHAGPSADGLCADCQALLTYAFRRLDHCRFGERKPACKQCPVHCYRPDMRERIRSVMRYAGPRMLWRHPMAALRHLLA